MTQDEIIRMARELSQKAHDVDGHCDVVLVEHLERFAALVAAHEREACADLCYKDKENNVVMTHGTGKRLDMLCAAAIRARKA